MYSRLRSRGYLNKEWVPVNFTLVPSKPSLDRETVYCSTMHDAHRHSEQPICLPRNLASSENQFNHFPMREQISVNRPSPFAALQLYHRYRRKVSSCLCEYSLFIASWHPRLGFANESRVWATANLSAFTIQAFHSRQLLRHYYILRSHYEQHGQS